MAKRFFLKAGVIFILLSVVVLVVFYARYANNTRYLLLNHLSNSICYNGNFQNLVENNHIDDIECLVIGSSMSLNNISGKMMSDSFHCNAYNLSSWGFRSGPILEFFKKVPLPKCRRVIIAFNNIDFGVDNRTKYHILLTRNYIKGDFEAVRSDRPPAADRT